MELSRRVEDLVLIFFSNAAKELQKGKGITDTSWKLMADRHVALFIRLISLVLKDRQDWSRDRPELTSRLEVLESKLLAHDQNLSADSSGNGPSTVEVEVSISHDVKDMPHVQQVARIFEITNIQIQSDLDKHKAAWTTKSALQDLKTYQSLLSLDSKHTLRSDDFDLEEGYEAWKKAEGPDIAQMMLTILQSSPELAKSTKFDHLTHMHSPGTDSTESNYYDLSRKISGAADSLPPDGTSSYAFNQPVDMSVMSPTDTSPDLNDDHGVFVFIPPDPRGYYRFILAQALTHDLKDDDLQPADAAADTPPLKLLSKQSSELLNELCLRWRLPYVSRAVLFLDVVREKFIDQELSLDVLDAAFIFIKETPPDNRKTFTAVHAQLSDRTKWTLSDFTLNQQILSTLHNALLRDLYDIMQKCYESKPASVGPIICVLEYHIYADPGFPKASADREAFTISLREGLKSKVLELYKEFLEKHLPQDQESWEFYHVIQLGKAVLGLAQRIQKRYRKNPEVLGSASRSSSFNPTDLKHLVSTR
jgi:hypothetical protein